MQALAQGRLSGWLPDLSRRAVDLLYPPRCIHCGSAAESAGALCAGCWSQIRWISRPFCERLGTPFAIDIGGPLLSPAAIADPPVFGRARAAAAYDGPARELVHLLKFSDREDIAAPMAGMMLAAGRELVAPESLLVPVPLHWTRLWMRRFNQSALLARALAERCGLACETAVLRRVKRTRPQVGLTKAERRANLQGAFRVRADDRPKVAGRSIILVDDVMTSSSTVNAASRILLRAGAARVDVITFAVVVNAS